MTSSYREPPCKNYLVISPGTSRQIVMYRFEGREYLTVRECEVVHLVAEGLSAKEAAAYLKIAPCTVDRHVENVRLKTRTRNRVHMIAYVLRHDLMKDFQPQARLSA